MLTGVFLETSHYLGRIGKVRNAYKIFGGKPEGKKTFGTPGSREMGLI
jgi:hypothetical protein